MKVNWKKTGKFFLLVLGSAKENWRKIIKLFLLVLGSAIVIFICIIVENVFLSTLCLGFGIFFIPTSFANQYFCAKDWACPDVLNKFLGWGIVAFCIAWFIGFLSGLWTVPEEILNHSDGRQYFWYLFNRARTWALVGGIITGLYQAIKQYNFLLPQEVQEQTN